MHPAPPSALPRSRCLWLALLLLVAPFHSAATILAAPPFTAESVRERVEAGDWEGLRGLGTGVLPVMARLYASADLPLRTRLANGFYALGWESPDAKAVLARDLGTPDRDLRITVQYALGRVSGENDVVDALLRTMRTDGRQLFRDKAACALAYDQIHLTPQGKVRLFLGLIAALDDPKLQVRAIAIQALEVHTGQRKGFEPGAPDAARARSIEGWRRWLYEYRSQL